MSNRNTIIPGHTYSKPGLALVIEPAPHGGYIVKTAEQGFGTIAPTLASFGTPEEAGAWITAYLIVSALTRIEATVDARRSGQ